MSRDAGFRGTPLLGVHEETRALCDGECILFGVPTAVLDPVRDFALDQRTRLFGGVRTCLGLISVRAGTATAVAVQHFFSIRRVRFLLHHTSDSHAKTDGHSLALVSSGNTSIFASFLHELYLDGSVDTSLHVDHVSVRVISTCEDHSRARGHLQVKPVKNTFTLVYFAQVLVKVVCHIKSLNCRFVIPDVPDLHGQVIAREQVNVAGGGEPRPRHRANNVSEEVPAGEVLFGLEAL